MDFGSVRTVTSWDRLVVAGSTPFSLGRLSFGELQPDTGVLLLLGDESESSKHTICQSKHGRHMYLRYSQPKNEDSVIIYSWRSKPVRLLFIFRTQIKIIFMKFEISDPQFTLKKLIVKLIIHMKQTVQSKFTEEPRWLYMMNRFNLGFYSHINTDQRT